MMPYHCARHAKRFDIQVLTLLFYSFLWCTAGYLRSYSGESYADFSPAPKKQLPYCVPPALTVPVLATTTLAVIGTSGYMIGKYGFYAFKNYVRNSLKRFWYGHDPIVECEDQNGMLKEWLESLERLVRYVGYMYVTRVERIDDEIVEVTYLMPKKSTDFMRAVVVGICKKVLYKKWKEKDLGKIVFVDKFRPLIEEFLCPYKDELVLYGG
jgi:hypothetical protein